MLPNSNTDAFTTRLGLQQAPRKRNSPTAPAKRDGPIWASVTVLQDHATSPSVQCNHCDKKFCGGATRIREHITGGGVIEACTSDTDAFMALKEKCMEKKEVSDTSKKQKAAEKAVDQASAGDFVVKSLAL